MTLIGLAGPIGAGKDTFGLYLQEHLDAHITSFAEPIRNLATFLGFGWASREEKEKKKIKTYWCIEHKLQQGIEHCMGDWEDNDKAELYAFLLETLEPHIFHAKYAWDQDSLMISPRVLMQKIGTEAGRRVRESIWTDALLRRVARHKYVVVTDVRFPDEAAVCKELIWINRPGAGVATDHASEAHHATLQRMAGSSIYNNGSIEDLNIIATAFAEVFQEHYGK